MPLANGISRHEPCVAGPTEEYLGHDDLTGAETDRDVLVPILRVAPCPLAALAS